MGKKDMKSALKNSLSVEEESVQDRFKRAELLFGENEQKDLPIEQIEQKIKRKEAKTKVIRDSFTMPQTDYDLINFLKNRSLNSGIQTTKSEILRAGLLALNQMTEADFLDKISIVEKIKTGRPKQTV